MWLAIALVWFQWAPPGWSFLGRLFMRRRSTSRFHVRTVRAAMMIRAMKKKASTIPRATFGGPKAATFRHS